MTKSAGAQTRKTKSQLMTMFLLDYEKFTKRRVTVELMRSSEWTAARDQFVKLFMTLTKGEKPNGNSL
jgi:hypothetical protein